MRFFGSRRFARSAPLAAAAVVLCIGVFLPWVGSGPEAPGSLAGLHHPRADQGTNGGGHTTPTGSYLAALGDEAKDGDKGPVNAGLLTALSVMFWAIVGWLPSNGAGPGASGSSTIIRRLSFVIAREDPPFLGVFRL